MTTKQLKVARKREKIFSLARGILVSEYASDLRLSSVAERLSVSPGQLQMIFSDVGRTTFTDLLTKIRMREATSLLADNALSIKEVANRVGYTESGYFAKTFCKYVGVVPTVYRRLHDGTGLS